MKLFLALNPIFLLVVALYMGAWIEIPFSSLNLRFVFVALYMGAWIEMINQFIRNDSKAVALYMGAWIEMACLLF